MVMSVQNFIMEAYADPLKYYPPDPANETDTKERRWEILYSTVLYMQHLHMQNALLDCVQEEKNIFICTIIVHDIIHLKYIHAYNLEGNQTDLE